MASRDAIRLALQGGGTVTWEISDQPVPYPEAMAIMDQHVEAIAQGREPERVWLLEHPPLYTAGTSARPQDLVEGDRFPVFKTGRGGQYTYHGPGQRVAYVMLDLRRRGGDVR
ncbi:MAG: lipoate-protein ligase B, partial [Aestuariivirga sp.]|nr:lipoate-protein ligase B [Aestuariivirga sp.]